ncbi:MAG TPA: universal stress protein [Thermoanaerobaculia bacterium]|nr:universal stress protein [Thermoanaerobaculia bacterium]
MIVCGTDFSPQAERAIHVASALARSLEEPLALVHAFDIQSSEKVLAAAQDVLLETVREDLLREAERVRALGVEVRHELLLARPDEGLVGFAERNGATMVVVSAIGWRSAERFSLGSVAERTVQFSSHPVLVVRDEKPFLQWMEGERSLRVIVAMTFTETSDHAIRWFSTLRRVGEVEAAAAHVFWPPDLDDESADPAAAAQQKMREMEQRLHELGEESMGVEVIMNASSPAVALLDVAAQNKADLLVIGERKRRQRTVLWQGSIPYSLLHLAPMSVAIVPV